MSNTATKDFAIKHAMRLERQLATTSDDLYGGSSALLPGAGDQIPVTEIADISKGSEYYTDSSANGTQYSGDKQKIAELPSLAGFQVKGYTNGIERLLLASLGYASPGGPVAVTSSAGYYAHLLCVHPQGHNQREYTAAEQALVTSGFDASDRINTYLEVSQELGPYERHLRNVCIKDVEFSCSSKNPLMIKVSGSAERRSVDTAKASCDAWSCPEGAFAEWFQMSNCRAYIQPASQPFTDLSSHVSITEMAIKHTYGVAEDDVPTGTSNGGLSRAEPKPTGKNTLTADLTVYLHDRTTYETWEEEQTILHCKLVFSRGNSKLIFLLPRLKCTLADPNFDGAGSVKLTLESAYPKDAAAITALSNSFATERAISGTAQAWPASSLLGLMVVSKESRNLMRWE